MNVDNLVADIKKLIAESVSKTPGSKETGAYLDDTECNLAYYSYNEAEKRHWDSATADEKRIIYEAECGMRGDGVLGEPTRFKLLKKGLDSAFTRSLLAISKDALGNQSHKQKELLNKVLQFPVGKYDKAVDDVEGLLKKLQADLDKCVYGHVNTKREIMRAVAQWITSSKGTAILLSGAAGTGKSSICHKGLAKALGMAYSFIGLGSMSKVGALAGFEFCYEGSHEGAIAASFIRHGTMSQVIMFDELDKASDEITNVLVHATDATTNRTFHDLYLGPNVPIDLSRCLMVFTCNDPSKISPILLDRMIKVDVPAYTRRDKACILREHLLPDALKAFGLEGSPEAAAMSNPSFVEAAVRRSGDEEGVRGLKRVVRSVCAEVNLRKYVASDAEFDVVGLVNEAPQPTSRGPPLTMYS